MLQELLQTNQEQLDNATARYASEHEEIERQETRYREMNASIVAIENQLTALREQLASFNLEKERGQQRIHFQREQLIELDSRTQDNDREITRLNEQETQHQNDILSKQ